MTSKEAGLSVPQGAGLPEEGKPAFLVVGRLHRTHGVRGECIMEIITDFPDRLKIGSTVYIGENHQPQAVRSLRHHAHGLIIGFEAILTPEAAVVLRDQFVYVPTVDLPPLPDGEYYHHQLLGLVVRTSENEVLGKLVQILQTGANDVLVVKNPEGSELLIPYIPDVVVDIDLNNGVMVINLLTGLLPE